MFCAAMPEEKMVPVTAQYNLAAAQPLINYLARQIETSNCVPLERPIILIVFLIKYPKTTF